MNKPLNPASLTCGTRLVRDAGTDHPTRVQFERREPARGRKPAVNFLFSREWIFNEGDDGRAIAYDEDLIQFYQLESDVVRPHPEPQEEQPSLYQRWREGGDVYELAKEYGMTLHEAYQHITTESQHARAMSVADIMSPDFLDAVRDALETSDNPNQLLQRMQELERWKKLSEKVADLEENPPIQEQIDGLSSQLVNCAAFSELKPMDQAEAFWLAMQRVCGCEVAATVVANASRTSHSEGEPTPCLHRPVQLIDPLWGPGWTLLETEPEHPEVLRWLEENPDHWAARSVRRKVQRAIQKQDRLATPSASSDTPAPGETSGSSQGDQ